MSVASSHFWSSEPCEGNRNQSKLLSIYLDILIACKYIPEHLVLKKCDYFISWNRNYESRNQELSVKTNTKMCFNLHSSMKYFPASTTLGNQTWNRKLQPCFSNLTTPTLLKSKCGVEGSIACINVDTHICTIYSLRFVFQPLFLTSRLIQRTGCKTEADNVHSHNAKKLCTTDLWQMH